MDAALFIRRDTLCSLFFFLLLILFPIGIVANSKHNFDNLCVNQRVQIRARSLQWIET